ncbi:MAG: hypothetical protein DWB57_09870, partial [Candidatus Brocadia sp.]|nr:hypothetical protein [Candidatus Brocadia sp.]
EDLNDHDQLRIDPLLAVLCKKKDPTGQDRRSKIVLDLDATDDPIHGSQEGRFFHGYYGEYCYLPLYIFCDDYLLCAKLRTSGVDASEGAKEEIERVVNHVRNQWPEVKIVVRGDSYKKRYKAKWKRQENNMSRQEEHPGCIKIFSIKR